jgi:hypothetical protein
VGQSKVEEERPAGRSCSNSERTQEKRILDTGRRSRPDLSQHLPAPAFSPFDACLLSPSAFPLYLSPVRRASGRTASGAAASPPVTTMASHSRRERKRYQAANACKEGNNVDERDTSFFSEQRTWHGSFRDSSNTLATRNVSSASEKARMHPNSFHIEL